MVWKLSSHGKTQERALVVTDRFITKLDATKGFKHASDVISIASIDAVSIHSGSDGVCVLHLRDNNDVLFALDNLKLAEFVTHVSILGYRVGDRAGALPT